MYNKLRNAAALLSRADALLLVDHFTCNYDQIRLMHSNEEEIG